MIGTNEVLIIFMCMHLNNAFNYYFHVGFWNYTNRANYIETDLVKSSYLRGKRFVNNRLSYDMAEYSQCTGLFQFPYPLSVSLRPLYTLEGGYRIIIRNRTMLGLGRLKHHEFLFTTFVFKISVNV
jgi:hypothetical protein